MKISRTPYCRQNLLSGAGNTFHMRFHPQSISQTDVKHLKSSVRFAFLVTFNQCCGSGRLLSGSDIEIRIRILLNIKFFFLFSTFSLEFVLLKSRLFCFIHNFCFFFRACQLYFKKYLVTLLDFINVFLTFYGWIRNRIRTI